MVPKKENSDGGGSTDDVYAKVRLLRQSVQEVNALLDEDRLRDQGEERLRDSLPRQRRQHRSVPRGGCETPLDALIVPAPPSATAAATSQRSPPKKAVVVSTRVTANISGKYQVRYAGGCQ